MTQLQTLQTLLEHEVRSRDAALALQIQARQIADQAREQAAQLNTYRDDYRERWSTRMTQPTSMDILRCVQGFAGRLDEAIAQQQHAVERQQYEADEANERLLRCERRVASVQRLIERQVKLQAQAADRRDQKATDEQAQRLPRKLTAFAPRQTERQTP